MKINPLALALVAAAPTAVLGQSTNPETLEAYWDVQAANLDYAADTGLFTFQFAHGGGGGIGAP